MKSGLGNWVPISKGFLKHLPKDRAYTRLEAAYSLQCDYDREASVTITGYANLWRWSAGKVYRFFEEMGIEIKYPEETQKKRNQNGIIMNNKTELSEAKKRIIRLIDNKHLQPVTELSGKKNGIKTELKQTTTIDTKILDKERHIPYDTIKASFNEILGDHIPPIRVLSDARKRKIKNLWVEKYKSPTSGLESNSVEFWGAFFKYVKESQFLTGNNDRQWRADIDWLIMPKNFIKVFEGTYHKKA